MVNYFRSWWRPRVLPGWTGDARPPFVAVARVTQTLSAADPPRATVPASVSRVRVWS